MKRFIQFIALVLCTIPMALAQQQQEEPSWLRYTSISPDGRAIAFSYRGDIYTVPVSGGRATQITSNRAYEKAPVWSPDGSKIAFASDRDGHNFNVYITGREGGSARRISYVNSKNQVPVAFYDDKHIVYSADIRPDVRMGLFPYSTFEQLYVQSLEGGRPRIFSATTMLEPSIGEDGRILYTDIKGYEDQFRKHHTSPIARDVWMWAPGEGAGTYQKVTNFKGEDRNAVWLPGQSAFLYTSEQDGTFNIYKASVEGGATQQITHFTDHPVRYLSVDRKGNAAFSWNGQIYYLPYNGTPQRVPVEIVADYNADLVEYRTYRSGFSSADISPNEKEMAFVVRGEVFVTSIEYNTTRRITNTAAQERDVSFSPDGRRLVYAAERDGQWNLFMTELVRKDEKLFTYASELKERQLTNADTPSQQPVFSPDGKKIAFLRDRSAIYVLDLEKGTEYEVMNKRFNYSYSDGDQHFSWSPDSRWLLSNYLGIGGWNNLDVALIKADGSGEIINLTESGYSDTGAYFVMEGKAVGFYSDRRGFRSHGSWGSEDDIFLMFLDQDAYDTFLLNKEEREVLLSDQEGKQEDEGKKKAEKKSDNDEKSAVEPLSFELKNRKYRTVPVTRTTGSQGGFVMDKKGETLYYLAMFDGVTNLYAFDLVKGDTELLVPNTGMGSLKLGKDDSTLYLLSYNGAKKIKGKSVTPITFAAEVENNRPEERAYIFDHVVKQVANKFYDENLHGVDWNGYAEKYAAFLPHISNNNDFADMLSELLGELNASHTGARYRKSAQRATGSLGLFYDETYSGPGVRIQEVMLTGPMDRAKSIAKPGVVILKINEKEISEDKPIEYYLNGHANERVRLTMRDTDGRIVEESVKTISIGGESELLYKRWIAQRAEMVREWSGGKVGYVHVKGMDSDSYRQVFQDLLGKYRNCEAVVVDTRFNGGGWLHNDLAILLSGREYARFVPRGQYIGSEPFMQWHKPSVMLVSEGNYSDAHGSPWTYKELGIGKLVGTPVAGTMTAVWWETQVDPSLVFGIPQVTVKDMKGKALENTELQPDIVVYNSPIQNLKNYDAQLKSAVDELLKQINN